MKMNVIGLCLLLLPLTSHGGILQKILGFKDKLFGGLFEDGNCGCPCREYYVPTCATEFVEHCYQDGYETKCVQEAVSVSKQVKEIECQKCRKFQVTVYKPKWFKECYPVYDEKCSTKYEKHCKTVEKCTEIYQTVCQASYDYQQHCEQIPSQTCYPETICHKTPQTLCHPVRKDKCEKVKRDVAVQEQKHECLQFQSNGGFSDHLHANHQCPDISGGTYSNSDHLSEGVLTDHSHAGGHEQQHFQQEFAGYPSSRIRNRADKQSSIIHKSADMAMEGLEKAGNSLMKFLMGSSYGRRRSDQAAANTSVEKQKDP